MSFIFDFLETRRVSAISLALFAVICFGGVSHAQAETVAADQERLVTVYEDGAEQAFVTREQTVGDALKKQGVRVEGSDLVEPAMTEKLVAKDYKVNIYRARPVVVVDGTKSIRVTTAEQSAQAIAKQANVTLYPEDKTKFNVVSGEELLSDGGAGLRLEVDRATTINFNQYGKPFTARTQSTTVGDMLKEKGIVLGANDGVSPVATTPITEGMEVKVWRNGKQTVTVEEAIPKQTQEVKDLDHEVGYREVKTPGADGKKNVTYEIDMQNGVEVTRKAINSTVIVDQTTEVVAVGAKPKVYTGSHADWMAAAGIAAVDYNYVEKLIQKESGWNPYAVNSGSGACGLVQALPCSKLGPNWNDPVVALIWGNNYVSSRYGGWSGAWAHSQSYGWY